MSKRKSKRPNFIDDVQVTSDCLTSRAGLNLFARYLRGIDFFPHITRLFGAMRKHPKVRPLMSCSSKFSAFSLTPQATV